MIYLYCYYINLLLVVTITRLHASQVKLVFDKNIEFLNVIVRIKCHNDHEI